MVFCYSSKNWLQQLVKEHKKEKKKKLFWPKWIQTLNGRKERLWRVVCKVHFLKHSLHKGPHTSLSRVGSAVAILSIDHLWALVSWGSATWVTCHWPGDQPAAFACNSHIMKPWIVPELGIGEQEHLLPLPGMHERLTSVVLIQRCPGNQVEKGLQWSEISHVKNYQ